MEIANDLGIVPNKVLTWIRRHGIEYIHHNMSYPQKTITNYVESFGFDILKNDRKTINPLELDIFIPEKRLAIEMNGVYWHCDEKIHKTYHQEKVDVCNNNNITLLQFWDIEWENKSDICSSIIRTNLGINDTIFARKCTIKEINSKEAKEFLNENHIQGSCKSKIKIGLYYNGELVSLMTLGKPRFNKNYEWELHRFCNKMGYTINGGASKLLKYFEKNYKPKNIISYSDRRLFNGGLYERLGFSHLYNTNPNYFYVKNGIIKQRYECQKHKLNNILPNFDPNKTEVENMKEHNWYRVFDCGNGVWEINYGENDANTN